MFGIESLSLANIALLAGSGLLAGLVNAVAGGGTFFTFSALVAVGLPPVIANATSAVAVTPANLASAVAYRREIGLNRRRFALLGLVSFAGGLIGAYALTWIGNAAFRTLVPWLMLAATILFAASPYVLKMAQAMRGGEGHEAGQGLWVLGLLIQFVTSIYGGFFGAGMGIVMLAALAITEGDDYHLINAAKVLCSTLIQAVAIVVFIAKGLVHWPETIVVGAASIIGGYAGVVGGRRIPAKAMRILIVLVGAILTIYFFWDS